MARKVVVDVDAGTDDAVALLLLLALERDKDYEIVGVTCTHGNTTIDCVCRNVLTTLEHINRLDIPVFRGAEGPLVVREDPVATSYFHGRNGFSDKEFPPPRVGIQRENAVVALNRMAVENEGIALICLGPLTNIALALRTYPGFSRHLKEVYIMGGNVTAVGNCSPAAEFNFFEDPEAAHIVLSSLSCPVTVVPWESCQKISITTEERFGVIGNSPAAHMKLLNEIERELYPEEFWTPCDAILAAVFVDELVIRESRGVHMTVELHGLHTRGQCVLDHLGKKRANVRIVDGIDADGLKKLFYKMASFIPEK